ncbi:MAG TPA: carotenoid oxygenase family protein [Polyangiaceae bacterium LLY-WYZ-15_(1-7)]|nr:hypothetical protein [Myxococcales bacterium]MAT26045.1 hypothetical protein [Sandaracinus sp.]HJK95261.1 carotenoid oxygenase family protein [Polyangiaceae bacterium LLY-WYZ-15_(1-7)]MBJ73822.1 hypothetical protein [Sandaracinus sp.]HJL04957.1 carotenoid oxygenase family protein [Polyangiaceae bacterium LLY-WYZ-15_(1-7)]
MTTLRPRAASAPEPSPDELRRRARAAWIDAPERDPTPLRRLAGALPASLRGTLYRNGPSRFRVGEDALHPFDGDGQLRRFTLGDGGITFSARFVATRERAAEDAAGRLLHRGLGTPAPGGPLANAFRVRFRNAANTGVLPRGDRVWALWEGGWPHVLDAASLETLGRSDLGGVLRNRSPLESWIAPELPLAAHTRRDPREGVTYGFGLARGLRPRLCLYALDPTPRLLREVPVAGLPFVHDFALTERFFVFLLPAVHFDLARALAGTLSPLDAMSSREGEPMRLLLVPRDGGPARTVGATRGFAFHLAQAFEEGGELVVDAFVSDRMMNVGDDEALFGPEADAVLAWPTRLRVDLESGAVRARRLSDHAGELPAVAPGWGARRVVYYASAPRRRKSPFLSAVARLDVEAGRTHALELYPWIVGEPIVVPRSDAPGDDWLLVVRTWPERDRAELLVIDGPSLALQGRWALPHALPPGFHGAWVGAPAR